MASPVSLANLRFRASLLAYRRGSQVANMPPRLVEYRPEANSVTNDVATKVARCQAALSQLTERIAEDRFVLADVLVGSLL